MTAPAPAPYDFLAIGANASGGFHLYVTDANGRKIAAVWGKAEEKEATARLFVASAAMREALTAASHALRSYQYGNSATDLAQEIADSCDAALALCEAQS